MNTEIKASVEHHLRLRIRTALLMLLPTSCMVVGIVTVGLSLDMAATKELNWKEAVFIGVLGLLGIFGFGWIVLRFVQRVWNVKTIRVLAGQQLEITTRTRRKFTAKLPDDIRYVIKDGESLTVAVQVSGRRFVMDSAEYSDSRQLNEFFQQFVKTEK